MTKNNQQIRTPRQWHPAFFATIQIELKKEQGNLSFENEHQLSAKPLIVDVIIIKKDKNLPIKKNIGQIFRKYNLFEYKSPTDYLSIDDYYKTFGYACFYKSDTLKVNSIKIHEISISFVCEGYPRKLMKHLRKFKHYEITKKYRGIYYVTGAIIPIQFIIRNQLSEQENLWLKGLTDKLKVDGTAELLIDDYSQNYDNPLYEAALQMIMGANKEFFEKEVNVVMCKELYELFEKQFGAVWDEKHKNELEETYDAGRNEGLITGRNEGLIAGRNEGLIAGRNEGLINMVELCKEMNLSLENTILKVTQKLKEDSLEVRTKIENIWNVKNA